jgi:phosphatidylglycerol:prolipoprotein diacylglycerol transferase
MLNAVVMFFVLLAVRKYRKFYGQICASFLIYYGITRFFLEFFRGDDDRGLFFNNALSTGQIVMIISFVSGVLMWLVCKKYKVEQ